MPSQNKINEWLMPDPREGKPEQTDKPSPSERKVVGRKKSTRKDGDETERISINLFGDKAARFNAAWVRYITKTGKVISKAEFTMVLTELI